MPRCRTALAMGFMLAAGAAGASQGGSLSTRDIERMTPAQLQAMQAELGLRSKGARTENAALRRRVETLEQRHAASLAKQAELEAELAAVRDRLATLQAERRD